MAKGKTKTKKTVELEKAVDKIEKAQNQEDLEKLNEEIKQEDEKVNAEIDQKIDEVEKKLEKLEDEIGKANWNPVHQKQGFIKTVSLKTPIPMYQLPEDIQQYLRNKCFWTNVYQMDKEWLEKHHADMNMIKKLKDFISTHFN